MVGFVAYKIAANTIKHQMLEKCLYFL